MAGQTGVTVRILSNRLPAIPAAARAAVSDAVKRAALDVQAAAQQMAPVRTGTLRRSIHAEFPTALSARIGPSVEYGAYVEFGTRNMGARPYLRPAAERVLPKFAGQIRSILERL